MCLMASCRFNAKAYFIRHYVFHKLNVNDFNIPYPDRTLLVCATINNYPA